MIHTDDIYKRCYFCIYILINFSLLSNKSCLSSVGRARDCRSQAKSLVAIAWSLVRFRQTGSRDIFQGDIFQYPSSVNKMFHIFQVFENFCFSFVPVIYINNRHSCNHNIHSCNHNIPTSIA